MYCPACGDYLPDDSSNCSKCGDSAPSNVSVDNHTWQDRNGTSQQGSTYRRPVSNPLEAPYPGIADAYRVFPQESSTDFGWFGDDAVTSVARKTLPLFTKIIVCIVATAIIIGGGVWLLTNNRVNDDNTAASPPPSAGESSGRFRQSQISEELR